MNGDTRVSSSAAGSLLRTFQTTAQAPGSSGHKRRRQTDLSSSVDSLAVGSGYVPHDAYSEDTEPPQPRPTKRTRVRELAEAVGDDVFRREAPLLAGTGLLGQPHVRHAILGGGAEATDDEEEPRVYTSLTTAANTAMDRYMDQQLRGPRSHMNCFICNFQERYEREVYRRGGQGRVQRDDLYVYALLSDAYYRHPNQPPGLKAQRLNYIYGKHVYWPAYEANGNRHPKHLPRPDPEVFLEHILLYTYDPVAKQQMCLQYMEQLLHVSAERALVSDVLDPVATRYMHSSCKDLWAMYKDFGRQAGGMAGPFALDPRKMMEFAGTGPLEDMEERNNTLLGGATATDHEQAMSRVTTQRPTFGNVQEVDEDEEEDILEDEDDEEDD